MADAPMSRRSPPCPTDYVVPKVWSWDRPSGGQFASINRPIAGPTHDKCCRSASIRCSFIRSALPTGRRSRSCSRSCSPPGMKRGI